MAHISDLPIDVLLHIFRIYLETEKQKNLLNVIAEVCISWKHICFEKSFWAKYDGTPTFENMIYIYRKGCLSNTKELILSKTGDLMGTDKVELFNGVKNIEVIDFSNVKQISEETLSIVAQNCTKIKKIQIGCPSSRGPLRLSYEMLNSFFPARGCGIVKIDLSYCHIFDFLKCLRCISEFCPNLQYLHLVKIYCPIGKFPTDYVQMHCPKLKGLYLDQNIKLENKRHPSGFPELEEFSYLDYGAVSFSNETFECILFSSPKIKFLSLENSYISATFMLALPTCSVEYLDISRCRSCSFDSLCDVFEKWSHSLKEVDVSYGDSFLPHAILKLVRTPIESPLEVLNLNFAQITLGPVEQIIENCKHLQTLKLERCTNILCGMQKTYSNKSEIADLLEKIKAYRSKHPCEVYSNTNGYCCWNGNFYHHCYLKS